MRGISRQAVPYVPDCDRGLPEEEQTTFWVKPRKGIDGARIVALYTAAERANPGQYREVSESKWRKADLTAWLDTVERVSNYHFSEDHADLHAQSWIEEITDPDLLEKVARDIPLEVYNEVVNFASRVSSLTSAEKNGSPSSPTGRGGSGRRKTVGEATTA